MFRCTIGTAILLILVLAGSGLAGTPTVGKYLTNVELVQLAVKGALQEGLAGMPALEGKTIAVRSLEMSEIDWLVEAELLGELARGETGIRLYQGTPSAAKKKRGRKGKEPLAGVLFDTAPVFVSGDPIAVPGEVCEKGLGGEVIVRLIINESGSVANMVVEESTEAPLEEAAKEGVSAWRFEPAGKDGKPVMGPVFCRVVFPEPEGDDCEGAVAESEFLESYDPEEAAEATAANAPQPPVSDEVPVLTYRVSELEFLYPSTSRKLWLGPRRVNRYGRTRIELRLEKGGEVTWASSAEHYVSDQVPVQALPELAGSQYEFSSPPVPQGSGKLVEPVIIAGIVGGMIALFYTNQAAD